MEMVFFLGTGFGVSPSFFLHGVARWDASCICVGALIQMLGVVVVLYLSFVENFTRVAFPPKMSKVMFRPCADGSFAIFGGW